MKNDTLDEDLFRILYLSNVFKRASYKEPKKIEKRIIDVINDILNYYNERKLIYKTNEELQSNKILKEFYIKSEQYTQLKSLIKRKDMFFTNSFFLVPIRPRWECIMNL